MQDILRRVSVTADDRPERRIIHLRNVPHSTGTFNGVSGLCTIPLTHRLFRVDMVIRRILVLAKHHTAASPISPESTRLNAGELDVPLRFELVTQRFCEALYSPLGRAVDGERGYTALATD